MTEKQKKKRTGRKRLQNKHAYDKVTAEGKGEKKYSSTKEKQ